MKHSPHCIVLLTAFLSLALIRQVDGILCSVCDSEEMSDCMTQPPPPENCTKCAFEKDNECLEYTRYNVCIIVTKYDQNDTLIGFNRGCSPVGGGEGCMEGQDHKRADPNVKICNLFCNTDGCNGAVTVHPHPLVAMVMLTSGLINIDRISHFMWS